MVLAAKGGVDVNEARRRHPRLAEVPFDSANKFMATVHEMITDSGDRVVRLLAKGAPDVLLARATTVIDRNGARAPMAAHHDEVLAHNERLASQGLRVLAVAIREFDPDTWHEFAAGGGDPTSLVDDLTLFALA
ncbi:MAG: ATPase, partial [Ilumatobacteraceae bacterium]